MNIRRITIFILLLSFSLTAFPQSWKYSIDKQGSERKQKTPLIIRLRIKIKNLFHEDKQKKADEKKRKREEREKIMYQKRLERYNEKQGKDKEIISGERVSKRMKRIKKQSGRVNHNQTRLPFYKRIFLKNKQKPTKFKK
ncbi:MAG: hypothetical protein A2309_00070 [Bacteroidetes bacterium RIFOXYB2_FULL_35_7]|nr:MAG: hypothetical protein A2X01_09150 [Bacteroidetes bacterium GWF2_35_48]OFY97614.1 MAG: hypothetical protein A2309_00070 [Bacteroidetes bacterium RIFOXYB2_FULL_35_7]HBX52447.1 hypothetical protein [Bacteroidales bacterium]